MAQNSKKFSDSTYSRISTRRQILSSMRKSKHTALPAYFEMEHAEKVVNALESIETDVMSGKPIRWEKLFPVIRGIRVNTETAPDCLNFVKELLGLFERYHCKEMRVISDVFAVLLFITEPYLEPSLEFELISFYSYGKEDTNIDFVWRAVKSGDPVLLKLQLKFGMEMEMMLPSSLLCAFHIDELLVDWSISSDDNIREYESTADYEIFVENGIIIGFKITDISEEAIERNLSLNFNPESMKRLIFVLRMLDVTLAVKLCPPYCREHYAECFKLLFDSIPAAFVTSTEVKASLEKSLPVSCSRLISRITQDFQNTLPELADVPQPRSLNHLCRIEIRRSLRKNLNLPSGVSLLPLPKILKQYIMLNDDVDYSAMIGSSSSFTVRRDMGSNLELSPFVTIPERDDCVTSFLKNL